MSAQLRPLQHLLTLPPRMAAQFAGLEGRNPPAWFASSDPVGTPLGSGGGTANLLVEAWRASGWVCRAAVNPQLGELAVVDLFASRPKPAVPAVAKT